MIKKLVNLLKKKKKCKEVEEVKSLEELIKKIKTSKLLMRTAEVKKVKKDLTFTTSYPIECKEDKIKIHFYEMNKKYSIYSFEIVDKNKIKISEGYYKIWSVIDKETPWIKIVNISYLRKPPTNDKEIIVSDGKIYIRPSITSVSYVLEDANNEKNCLIDSKGNIESTLEEPTIFVDRVTNKKYKLQIIAGNLVLKEV